MQETEHHRKGTTMTKITAPNIATTVPVDCPFSALTPLLTASFRSAGMLFRDELVDADDIAVRLYDMR